MSKIPKVIHYCWFGQNEMPEEYKKNIDTWKKKMPDYEIIKWDESNYNCKKNEYLKSMYSQKKWAFVSDYARLDIIYNNGGIYLDTDVEVIKSFDDLLENEAFMGLETGNYVNTGIGFGAKERHEGIKKNLDYYNNLKPDVKNNKITAVNCPVITTNLLKENGAKIDNSIEKVIGITIYPMEYFCPKNYFNGKLNITNNTHSIHHYSMSWLDALSQKKISLSRRLQPIFGNKISFFLARIIYYPKTILYKLKNKIAKK